MKILIFFFTMVTLISVILCRPEPRPGFFEGLAESLAHEDRGALSEFGQGLLDAFARVSISTNIRHRGILGEVASGVGDAAGTLTVTIEPNLKMPPKKDGAAPKEEKKKARKRNKPRKKKDECPSRIRKTDRVVLNKQARDIIAKVYDFMKREALADYAEKISNARWRTATAAGVSEKTVSRILKDRSKKHTEGSAVAGADAFVHGKIDAAKNYGQALGDLVTGNISGAAHSLATGVGDCIGADVAGLGIAASGVADATGQLIGTKIQADSRLLAAGSAAAGEFVGGNLVAAADVASGISALVSDDLTVAGRSFGSASASLVSAESDAINTFLSKF